MNKKGTAILLVASFVVMSLLVAVLGRGKLAEFAILKPYLAYDPLDLTEDCFDYWKNTLKDPFSARIVNSSYGKKPLSTDSLRLVDVLTVEYRAKNSYGAYGPGEFECILDNEKVDEMGSRIRAAINE